MSKKLKLSPWHDGSVKPVHIGVYEVYCDCCNSILYSNWDGEYFCKANEIYSIAYQETDFDADLELRKWRGVLK